MEKSSNIQDKGEQNGENEPYLSFPNNYIHYTTYNE